MYRPLQPGITDQFTQSGLCYREFAPHIDLQPYIHCYWHIQSDGPLAEPFIYRVIPDGCVDILMNVAFYEGAVIATTMREPAYVPFSGQTDYAGVRFLPGCANIFLNVPLSDLLDEMTLIKDVKAFHSEKLETYLFETENMAARIQRLDQHFLKQLQNTPDTFDKRVLSALKVIYQTQGNPISKHLSDMTSSRHLRRLFQKHTGVSPKIISRIVRFQMLMRAILQAPDSFQTNLESDFGYYDQSHFIREFKNLYGETPGRFLHSLQRTD